MKIQHLILSTLVLLLSLNSCKKETRTQFFVSGQVLEYGTNQPIVGATVGVYNSGTNATTNTGVLENTTLSDENGRYRIPFDSETFSFVQVSADKYFQASEEYLSPRVDNEFDFILDPHAWLKLKVKNVAPAEETDIIQVGYQYGLGGWNEFGGQDVDETIIGLVRGGNKDGYMLWDVYDVGVLENQFRDTLYIPAHDTLYYEINY